MPLIPENLGASTIVIKLKLSLYKLENTSNLKVKFKYNVPLFLLVLGIFHEAIPS